jgi:hypothetical protein
MVHHLQEKVGRLLDLVTLGPGDVVLDIGSNDSTLLRAYPDRNLRLGGIDPSAVKFRHFYPNNVGLIAEFFSAGAYRQLFGESKAQIVTSIAMLYDLPAPQSFFNAVALVLADDGVWHSEQSYMPTMLAANAYDTACQEHLEYYALSQIKDMAEKAELKIIDLSLNSINGGSLAITLAKKDSPYKEAASAVRELLEQEEKAGLATLKPYKDFAKRVSDHREALTTLVRTLNSTGKRVIGYGASTKGNVLLQYCGFSAKDIPCIAEVNPDKFGCYTPGTQIPIVSELQARSTNPDFMLVLPWHFRENIIAREQVFLDRGGKLIFPLPYIDVVGHS